MKTLKFDEKTLKVRRISSALGAEILGIQLAKLDVQGVSLVENLLMEHKVLLFPNQNLSIDEHLAFGSLFGDLEAHPHYENPITKNEKIFELAASQGGIADEWHSDITFQPNPALFSILNMVKCPQIGGDTLWANPELAYEKLSPALRELCEGLTALHNADPHGRPDVMTIHPVVRIHPVTGKKVLFVNEHFTRRIVELSNRESTYLLEYLTQWIGRTSFTMRYQWKAGTIAMWDNRCTQHKVLNDFNEERVVQRVTVMGDKPEGSSPKWEPFIQSGHDTDKSRYDNLLLECLNRKKS
ncbi:MAG: TauD/TfdA family dioxygenase [Pseudomonadota bacterium]|nr:TauD/TfdA family dioxygenase [Pseudomonadota bacterium]